MFKPATYDLIRDYATDPEEGIVTGSPYWVIAVVRLKNPLSYDRDKRASMSNNIEDVLSTRAPTLVVSSSCTRLVVQCDKGNHLKSAQAQLLPIKNYMREILAGDWMLCWMVYGEDKKNDLVRRIRAGKPCNRFDDGLKFLGRVQSIRKGMVIDRGSGTRSSRYNLQGVGFRELDAQTFYDPYLAEDQGRLSVAFARIGASISSMITSPSDDPRRRGGILTEKAIPQLFELLLGSGVSKDWSDPARLDQVRIATGLDQNIPMGVPKDVGALLGKTSRSASANGGILPYADLCEVHYGLQRFTETANVDTTPANPTRYRAFLPDGLTRGAGQYRFTGKHLSGSFVPTMPNFSNKSVWTILQQWVNPLVNEMYTALKVSPQVRDDGTIEGGIVPTLVLRQLPFTSPIFYNAVQNGIGTSQYIPEVTPYHELPRWRIDPALVYEFDIGRSDAVRFNFLRVDGAAAFQQSAVSTTKNLVRSPPIRDDLDIARNGLRAYTATVNCSVQEMAEGPKAWMDFASDYIFGQHLSFTGTVNMCGVEAPLAEGDNVEIDEVLFHVETIVHQCQIEPDGKKSFVTSLNLSHGLSARDTESAPFDKETVDMFAAIGVPVTIKDRFGGVDDQAQQLYPGMADPNSNTAFEGGVSVDDADDEET